MKSQMADIIELLSGNGNIRSTDALSSLANISGEAGRAWAKECYRLRQWEGLRLRDRARLCSRTPLVLPGDDD